MVSQFLIIPVASQPAINTDDIKRVSMAGSVLSQVPDWNGSRQNMNSHNCRQNSTRPLSSKHLAGDEKIIMLLFYISFSVKSFWIVLIVYISIIQFFIMRYLYQGHINC